MDAPLLHGSIGFNSMPPIENGSTLLDFDIMMQSTAFTRDLNCDTSGVGFADSGSYLASTDWSSQSGVEVDDDMNFDYEISRSSIPEAGRTPFMESHPVVGSSAGRNTTKRRSVEARKHSTCPVCSKAILKRALPRHKRTVHRRQQPGQPAAVFCCSQCAEKFARKDNLDRHHAEQHGDKTGFVQCPGCDARVRWRTLDTHFKSQRCQDAELQRDLARLRSLKASWIGSLKDPGRFDVSTAVDPLFIVLHIAFKFDLDEIGLSTMPTEFWTLQGMATRAIIRALGHPTEAEVPSLALANIFLAASFVDTTWEADRETFFIALIALEQRFDRILVKSHAFHPGTTAYAMLMHIIPETARDEAEDFSSFWDSLEDEWLNNVRPNILAEHSTHSHL